MKVFVMLRYRISFPQVLLVYLFFEGILKSFGGTLLIFTKIHTYNDEI